MKGLKGLVLAGALTMMATPASAAVIFTSLGTAAPPASVGGYTMTAFPDTGGEFAVVTSVASPLGGSIGFNYGLEKRDVPGSWATWSHGYTGDVYYTNGSSAPVVVSMPASTGAFYLYVEPNSFAEFDFLVCSGTTCSSTGIVGASGATGFAFHGTGGSQITSVTVVSLDQEDFAIGEFGIAAAVPEPASLALLGLGIAGLAARRRRQV